jgi:hypothetical protein
MDYVDQLVIAITGDVSGIKGIVSQTVNIIKGGVGDMNKEEVDWTSIFTRAVSPAVVAGIASMFAFAIAQSVNMQQSLATSGASVGDTTQQVTQLGTASLSMSSQVGSSAGSIASAMTQVGTVFGQNSQATQDIVQTMSQLTDAGFGPLNDIVASSLQLFKDFGVTTGTDAVSMLTDLMHGAQASGESVSSLASQFEQYAPALRAAGAGVSSFNGLISAFAGNIQALGLPSAEAQFSALASSIDNPAGAFEILGTSVTAVSNAIKNGDVNGLLDTVATRVANLGSVSQLVGQAFGFNSTSISAFIDKSSKLSEVDADVKNVRDNVGTITTAWNNADTAMLEFKKDWNILAADFTSSGLADWFTQLAKSLGSLLNGTFLTDLLPLLTTNGKLPNSGFKVVTPATFTPSSSDAVQKILSGTGLGFSANSLNSIDSTAVSSGLISSLVQALQSGGKGNSSSMSNIKSTFNLTLPSTGDVSASALAKALYNAFQGSKP